jgi:hypothetical protein
MNWGVPPLGNAGEGVRKEKCNNTTIYTAGTS